MDRTEERRRPGRLALVELAERDGRVLRGVDVVAWPLTLGRAIDNDVVLDDPFVAPYHARIDADAEGRLTLRALHSRNGVGHDGRRIAGGGDSPLAAGGATLQIGASRLRLRLPGETLAPERALPGGAAGWRSTPQVAALALFALVLANTWIGLDPGADYSSWLPVVVGLPVLLAGWCGVWALMSKLFQHRFDFAGHLRIALPWMLGIAAVDVLLPQGAAALAWPWLWHASAPLQSLLALLLVRAHLQHLLPLHQRAVTASVAALGVVGAGLSVAFALRSSDSLRPAPYMSTLPLPALRWSGTAPPNALTEQVPALAAKLAQRVQKARQEDAEDSVDSVSE